MDGYNLWEINMWEVKVGEDQRIICNGEPEIRYPILHYVNFWQDECPEVITEIDISYSYKPLSFMFQDNRKNYILGSVEYAQQYKFDVTQDIWVSKEDW